MERGGKITRAAKVVRAEQIVLATYTAEVNAAIIDSGVALGAQIAASKAKRNEALERIREGERTDPKTQKAQKDRGGQAAGDNEAGCIAGQVGNEPERSTKSGVEGEGEETQKD